MTSYKYKLILNSYISFKVVSPLGTKAWFGEDHYCSCLPSPSKPSILMTLIDSKTLLLREKRYYVK